MEGALELEIAGGLSLSQTGGAECSRGRIVYDALRYRSDGGNFGG
jgi:hypothetical protein